MDTTTSTTTPAAGMTSAAGTVATATPAISTPGQWRFFLYSGIGVFAFMVPFPIAGDNTILLDHIGTFLKEAAGPAAQFFALTLILVGTVRPFVTGTWRSSVPRRIFSFLNIFASVLALALIFGFGPAFIFREDLGPFLFEGLVVKLAFLVPVGAPFLGLLISYGLMEFFGVLMRPIMRPLFRVPGRAAIDAMTSFVGSDSLAMLVTNRVYKSGAYTTREAVTIAAGFTTCSMTFMIILAETLGLMNVWGLYVGATMLVTFAVTAVIVRLRPIKNYSEDYYPGATPRPEKVFTQDRFRSAWNEANLVLRRVPSLPKVLWDNTRDGLFMVMQVLPGIMSVGFIGLALSLYTPLFSWLGLLFVPLLTLLRIPDAQLAAEAMASGLAEIYLPALIAEGNPSLVTRLLVGIVAVSQVFFFSSPVPDILATDIPITIRDIVIVWFLRVFFSILIGAPLAYGITALV
ncbi:YjiH family protein [Corynebacterium incognita]|nr:YjiH family protein [Corynebacterium incognita]